MAETPSILAQHQHPSVVKTVSLLTTKFLRAQSSGALSAHLIRLLLRLSDSCQLWIQQSHDQQKSNGYVSQTHQTQPSCYNHAQSQVECYLQPSEPRISTKPQLPPPQSRCTTRHYRIALWPGSKQSPVRERASLRSSRPR